MNEPGWQKIAPTRSRENFATEPEKILGQYLGYSVEKVAELTRTGVLTQVTSIQRINTKGGKAPASGCDAGHAGQEVRVPYSADYLFFAPK